MTNQPFIGNDSWSAGVLAGQKATLTANSIERDKDRVIYPLYATVQICAPGPCALVQITICDVDGAAVRNSGPVLVGYVPVTVTLHWPTNVRSKLVSASQKDVVIMEHFCSGRDETWKNVQVLIVGSIYFRSEREQFVLAPCANKLTFAPIPECPPVDATAKGPIGPDSQIADAREMRAEAPVTPFLGGEASRLDDRILVNPRTGSISSSWGSLPNLRSVNPDEPELSGRHFSSDRPVLLARRI